MSKMGFIAVLLVLALVGGGLGHAVLPHTHSHGHGVDFSWTALHTLLRGSEQKILLGAEALLLLVLCFVVIRALARIDLRSRTRLDLEMELLRRGIAPHRRFG